MTGHSIDELVSKVQLYRFRPLIFHGYVLPFLILYASWLYIWLFIYGFTEHYEGGFVGLAVIGVLQILSCLFCHWSVHVQCLMSCIPEKDPNRAEYVKVIPTENNGSTELVRLLKSKGNDSLDISFMFQKTKYVLNSDKKQFSGLEFPVNESFSFYNNWKGYQDDSLLKSAEAKYGKNMLDMVVPEFRELFFERATAPFFVFQVFCVALWCLDRYWYYSIFTLFMLILFECTLVQQQLRNMAEIRKMGNKPYSINVYRNRKWRVIHTDELIPGDIVSLVRSQMDNLVPCDLLLLRGSCIIDESMLTGESVPQMKEPIENFEADNILDLDNNGKLHALYGGTKIVQHSPPTKTSNAQSNGLRAPDNGCIAYVMRTGFNTSQGKLLRTILFGVKRITANNLETFGFIMFLLIFAIAAAWYVWVKGSEDPNRNRYRLFLECTLILTSVVPPELPVELSLAVNTSLLALSKLSVFCTEPFRIPFAGKVEICCFDKTGTLTSDDLVIDGIAGLPSKEEEISKDIVSITEIPQESTMVLASCHSLVQLDEGIVGDPLEKTTLAAVDWNLTKADAVIPKKGKSPGLKIFQRYHFSSALKRMCVVAGYNPPGTTETEYIVCVKGAPEVLKDMFVNVNESQYNGTYLEYARRGARVLSLGYRPLGKLSTAELRNLTRDELEKDLKFVGFIIISCPLKSDSKAVIKELVNASHYAIMITGDNALTACHVAKMIKMTRKAKVLILTKRDNGSWEWESVDQSVVQAFDDTLDLKTFVNEFDFCITGDGLGYLTQNHKTFLNKLLPHVKVFARFAPKQKEQVILALKALGFCTLMCGDGTNDVGALKHADVGVAILSNAPSDRGKKVKEKVSETVAKVKDKTKNDRLSLRKNADNKTTLEEDVMRSRLQKVESTQNQLKKMMKEIEEQENLIVKLGDASIAAPFTSKLSTILCVCHIIKQGRCTLVTTLQMFKILALNALILAYSQSVLYLDGIRFSDYQATLQGLLLAACFWFISRAKPLQTLSKQRPLPNIFNAYTVLTVLLQFAVHFVCLVFLVGEAKHRMPGSFNNETQSEIIAKVLDRSPDEEEEFEKNILNSAVYIISIALQVSTFAINYRGRPFMEDLSQNKPLMYSIIVSCSLVLFLAAGWLPDNADQFEIVNFPEEFRKILVITLIADFVCSYVVDRLCLFLFGEGKLRSH